MKRVLFIPLLCAAACEIDHAAPTNTPSPSTAKFSRIAQGQ